MARRRAGSRRRSRVRDGPGIALARRQRIEGSRAQGPAGAVGYQPQLPHQRLAAARAAVPQRQAPRVGPAARPAHRVAAGGRRAVGRIRPGDPRVEVGALVEPARGVVVGREALAVEVADPVRVARAAAPGGAVRADAEDPADAAGIVRARDGKDVGRLHRAEVVAREVGAVGPVDEVGRRVEADAPALRERHAPSPVRAVPHHLRVAEVGAARGDLPRPVVHAAGRVVGIRADHGRRHGQAVLHLRRVLPRREGAGREAGRPGHLAEPGAHREDGRRGEAGRLRDGDPAPAARRAEVPDERAELVHQLPRPVHVHGSRPPGQDVHGVRGRRRREAQRAGVRRDRPRLPEGRPRGGGPEGGDRERRELPDGVHRPGGRG